MLSQKPNARQRFRIINMGGGMNTVAEENDLISLDPNARLGVGFSQLKTEFRTIKNFLPINRGGLSKTFGHTLFQSVAAAPITGLYRFTQSNGNSLFLVSCGTTLYKLVSGVLTSLYTSLAPTAYTSFETAYDKCIVCDSTNPPQVFDGSTVSTLGGSPPTGARQSLFYQNRLWIFGGSSNPSLLYYSAAGDITTGYTTNFVQCDVNDGQKITSIAKFFIPGQLEPVIIVGKERSVGIITGDGSVSNPYTFSKIIFNMGIPGHRQIIQFNDDAAFLTPRGVNSYQTAVSNRTLQTELLTNNIFDQFTSLSPTYLSSALCWEDWKRRRVSFAVPTANSQYPNKIWHFDIDNGNWYYQDGFNVTAALVDTDGTLYTGDETGKIVRHDNTLYSYNGNAINGAISTGYLDFFEPVYYKRIVWASATIRGNGSYGVGVSTKLNFGAAQGSSHTLNLTTGAYTWGGGVWTNDPGVYQWGGSPLVTAKFYPKGIFRNIQFNFTQSGVNQPLDLFELNFEVEYLSQY